jgi:hypothetical protein
VEIWAKRFATFITTQIGFIGNPPKFKWVKKIVDRLLQDEPQAVAGNKRGLYRLRRQKRVLWKAVSYCKKISRLQAQQK